MILSAILLALLLAIVAVNIWLGPRGYRRLREAGEHARTAFFRRMFLSQLLLMGVPAVIGLALLGRLDAATALPPELWSASAWLRFGDPAVESDPFFVWPWLGAVLVATPLGAALTWRRTRQGKGPPKSIEYIAALLPKNRAEVLYSLGISLAAGIGEELFFRLLLPMLLAVFVGGIAGAGLAIILFGLAHAYQGWKGIIVTTLVGAFLTVAYLMSGSIAIVMLFHVMIDLMTLVIRPVIRGAWAGTA